MMFLSKKQNPTYIITYKDLLSAEITDDMRCRSCQGTKKDNRVHDVICYSIRYFTTDKNLLSAEVTDDMRCRSCQGTKKDNWVHDVSLEETESNVHPLKPHDLRCHCNKKHDFHYF